MEFKLRKAELADLEECVRVEESAIKGFSYLRDVWNYFATTTGELTCVTVEDKICGIGKFTLLPDRTAWLETLRISPEYQGNGMGKAIYQRYFEQAKELGCPSMAMYTGISNAVSAGLAAHFGFEKAGEYRGYVLKDFTPDGKDYPFTIVDPVRASQLVMPLREEHGNKLIMNRTFYPFNEANVQGMAMDSLVFENPNTGSFVVCGARFQHLKAMHIIAMGGDYSECLEFVKRYAFSHEIPQLTCTFPTPNEKLENFLVESGFTKEASDLIVMEYKF